MMKCTLSFNPRLHTGDNYIGFALIYLRKCFNPRLHTGDNKEYGGDHSIRDALQSTSPHRRQQFTNRANSAITKASIHVSTQETTTLARSVIECCKCFNPRLHTGDNPCPHNHNPIKYLLQSTSPHRRQPIHRKYMYLLETLQSTSPHRRQLLPDTSILLLLVLQSTSPHRRQPASTASESAQQMLQSTSPHRRQQSEDGRAYTIGSFNPRLHTGDNSNISQITSLIHLNFVQLYQYSFHNSSHIPNISL